jgi:hypothetical protein
MATPGIFETLAIRLRTARMKLVIAAAGSLLFLLFGILLKAADVMSFNVARLFLPGCLGVFMYAFGFFLVQALFHGISAGQSSILRRISYWFAALLLDVWLLIATFIFGLAFRT